MLKYTVVSLISLSFLSTSQIAQAQSHAFENGQWFDGEEFVAQTMYAVDGVFVETKPDNLDETFDLSGDYVIPPFAEGHNHNLDVDYKLEDRIQTYLRDGVFYAKMQSSIPKRVARTRSLFGKFPSVDVAYAQAPITATGGHPIPLRESFFDQGRFQDVFETKSDIEGQGYFIVDTEEDLETIWPDFLKHSPDFLKLNLLQSEYFEARQNDPDFQGRKGLNPKLVPLIVEKAHSHGLRVSAHVDTPADFHHAIKAGVDEINHMPGRVPDDSGLIAAADARLAAETGVVVMTTASLIERRVSDEDMRLATVRMNMATNLRLLHSQGVNLAVGSDIFGDTSVGEAEYLAGLDMFTNLELLKIWVENTPKTIFPERKLGQLRPEYEASFLALEGSPVEDFGNIRKISMLYKQGQDISERLKSEP